jgi:predicted CxxxxCH...CXXCH cytochrome family protein
MPFLAGTVHGPAAKADLTFCNDCHGRQTGTGSYRFDVSTSSMPNGCESTGCHNNGQPALNLGHPKTWLTHGSAGNQASACGLCHGTTFQGDTGPACVFCHKNLPAGVIPVASQNCSSCHGNPPNGATRPNLAGSHAKHAALPGVTCGTCHLGAGSGSAFHYYSSRVVRTAKVKFPGAYSARTGTAGLNADKSCANIKCHGGRSSFPNGAPVIWGTSFDSANRNNCEVCHEQGTARQAPQYNSFYSGQHRRHLDLGLGCTDCHDQAVLFRSAAPSHFTNLTSASFNLDPSTTMKAYLNYALPVRSCSPAGPPSDNQFAFGCHPALDVTKFWGTP